MKAINFLEWYVLNEDNFYFNASGYLMTGEGFPVSDIAEFHNQPFKPEMITELFEGWFFADTTKYYTNGRDKFINKPARSSQLYHCDNFPGQWHTFCVDVDIKTLNDFISDCQRAGIKLIWKQEIIDKYFK